MMTERKLLVVDDEPIVGQSCKRIFNRAGYQVEACTDSREGLNRVIEQNNYSLILVDMKMPGMDGLEFITELRKTHPDLPVMIITGYASVPSATAAMRLGASDYLPKPFTPDEIIKAVERIFAEEDEKKPVIKTEVKALAPAIDQQTALSLFASMQHKEEYKPRESEFHFHDEAWLQLESTDDETKAATVRVGSLIAGLEKGGNIKVQLPKKDDKVFRGLPLASFTMQNGLTYSIPSPVTGVIQQVNPDLVENPQLAADDPCGEGWIASVLPDNLTEELQSLSNRTVLLATNCEANWTQTKTRINDLGCNIRVVDSYMDIQRTLDKENIHMLLFDASAFGISGPRLIRIINQMHPDVKIAVAEDKDNAQEKAYRLNKVLYYSGEKFDNQEISEILYSAFRPVKRSTSVDRSSSDLPQWISRFQIKDSQGQTVTFLAPDEKLARNKGLGWMMAQTLLRTGYPLQTDLTARPGSFDDVLKAIKESDSVFILKSVDAKRIPGTLVKKEISEPTGIMIEAGKKVVTYFVQPGEASDSALSFEPHVGNALSQFLVYEMISALKKNNGHYTRH